MAAYMYRWWSTVFVLGCSTTDCVVSFLCGVVSPGEWCQFGFSPPCPGHRSAASAFPPQDHCYAGERFQIEGSTVWSSPFLWHHFHCLPALSQSPWQLYLQSQPRFSPPGDANEESAQRTTRHQTHPQIGWEWGFHPGPAFWWLGSQRWKTEEQWQGVGHKWTWPEAWYTWERCPNHTGILKEPKIWFYKL